MKPRNRAKAYGSVIALSLTVCAFAVGCGGAAGNNSATGTANTNQNATVTTAGDATKGQTIFQQNCSSCHSTGSNRVVGPGLKGIMNKSSLPNGKSVNDVNVENWIRTGGGGMPGFPQLSDQQRADIVAYLKTLS